MADQESPNLAKRIEELSRKARDFATIRTLAGYVEDGSATTVQISQDDATRTWIVRAGKSEWYGNSLQGALAAARVEMEEP